jgi:hypothetical protein
MARANSLDFKIQQKNPAPSPDFQDSHNASRRVVPVRANVANTSDHLSCRTHTQLNIRKSNTEMTTQFIAKPMRNSLRTNIQIIPNRHRYQCASLPPSTAHARRCAINNLTIGERQNRLDIYVCVCGVTPQRPVAAFTRYACRLSAEQPVTGATKGLCRSISGSPPQPPRRRHPSAANPFPAPAVGQP